jgi:hypothetical protein
MTSCPELVLQAFNAPRDLGPPGHQAGKDVRICHNLTAAKVCVPEMT